MVDRQDPWERAAQAGLRLYHARTAAGLTEAQLAGRVGVAPWHIREMEAGRMAPGFLHPSIVSALQSHLATAPPDEIGLALLPFAGPPPPSPNGASAGAPTGGGADPWGPPAPPLVAPPLPPVPPLPRPAAPAPNAPPSPATPPVPPATPPAPPVTGVSLAELEAAVADQRRLPPERPRPKAPPWPILALIAAALVGYLALSPGAPQDDTRVSDLPAGTPTATPATPATPPAANRAAAAARAQEAARTDRAQAAAAAVAALDAARAAERHRLQVLAARRRAQAALAAAAGANPAAAPAPAPLVRARRPAPAPAPAPGGGPGTDARPPAADEADPPGRRRPSE